MGIFANIKEAKYSDGGVYVEPGVYRVQVQHVKKGRTRTAKDFFVVEMLIMESNNDKRKPGTVMSWMVTLDKEPALGNVKQFVSTATGCEMDEVDEAGVEEIVSERNPLEKTILRISAVEIMTKANRPFTKVRWLSDADGAA